VLTPNERLRLRRRARIWHFGRFFILLSVWWFLAKALMPFLLLNFSKSLALIIMLHLAFVLTKKDLQL